MQYELNLRTQKLGYSDGMREWQPSYENVLHQPEELAIVVVDMWNRHWCTAATRRAGEMAPRIDALLRNARSNGVLILHAPSDCMPFYAEHPARLRALSLPALDVPKLVQLPDAPQPVNAGDGGSDSEQDEFLPNTGVWHRQNEAIFIDPERDLITDDGRCAYAHFAANGIKRVLYVGVHTNMCVLHRTFAIKAMRGAGLQTALVRDLTDAMYNPAQPPYVSHAEGTRLVIEYIEKFFSPTVLSAELL
ncbi:MAG: cysteine hydrolase [Oscillospiraceae bacterium]|nr:cysteine hydrolase [Oscillospiraceae bacterium]